MVEPKLGGRIYVPDVHVGLTTQKVLVTEWIEGKQLAKSPKAVINRLTPVGVECFLVQVRVFTSLHSSNALITLTF